MKKLRVWNVINPPRTPNYHDVNSPNEAVAKINELAAEQLKDDAIFANAFGLEVFEDGEWSEWYSEDGEDIREYEESKAADA